MFSDGLDLGLLRIHPESCRGKQGLRSRHDAGVIRLFKTSPPAEAGLRELAFIRRPRHRLKQASEALFSLQAAAPWNPAYWVTSSVALLSLS